MSQQNPFPHLTSSSSHHRHLFNQNVSATQSNHASAADHQHPQFTFPMQNANTSASNYHNSMSTSDMRNFSASENALDGSGADGHVRQSQYANFNAVSGGTFVDQLESKQKSQQSSNSSNNSPTKSSSQSSHASRLETASEDEERIPFTNAELMPYIRTILSRANEEFHQKNGKRMAFRKCPICCDSIGTNGGNFKKHCFTCCEYVAQLLSDESNGDYFGNKRKVLDAADRITPPSNPPTQEETVRVAEKLRDHFQAQKKKSKKRKRDASPSKKKKKSPKKAKSPADDTTFNNQGATQGTISGGFTAGNDPSQGNASVSIMNPELKSMLDGTFLKSAMTESTFIRRDSSTKSLDDIEKDVSLLRKDAEKVRQLCQNKLLPAFVLHQQQYMKAKQQQ